MGVEDPVGLPAAFAGCEVVVHLAGICCECAGRTFESVHVDGTVNVISACRTARVRKLVLLSYLRARPKCGSAFHESKWKAEEFVRKSGLDFTILKASLIYGDGDHWLGPISRLVHTLPVIPHVGWRRHYIRPVAVDDLVDLLLESISGGLSRETATVLGPEVVDFCETVRRVAIVMGRHPWIVSAPVWLHRLLAWVSERASPRPMVSLAQVRMLSETMSRGLPAVPSLPEHLQPRTPFGWDQIRSGIGFRIEV